MSLNTPLEQESLIIISVVRDYEMYNRCVALNPHANSHTLHTIDNRLQNAPISILYNHFLDFYDYTHSAWLMFCHEDFELLEDPLSTLRQVRKENLYGPIGVSTKKVAGCLFKWQLLGTIEETAKDGSSIQYVGHDVPLYTPVETFDCQCLIVHSSVIFNTRLRFDPQLSFDLYVEDFCIQAKECHNIPSCILPLKCKHWSHGKVGERYHQQERYLKAKYSNCCYTGTSSYSIGHPPLLRWLNDNAKRLAKLLLRRD
jgi:hypothetical protein